jgi:hypothetical protein
MPLYTYNKVLSTPLPAETTQLPTRVTIQEDITQPQLTLLYSPTRHFGKDYSELITSDIDGLIPVTNKVL